MCFSDSDDHFDTPLHYTETIFMGIPHFCHVVTQPCIQHANPSSEWNTNSSNQTWRRLHLPNISDSLLRVSQGPWSCFILRQGAILYIFMILWSLLWQLYLSWVCIDYSFLWSNFCFLKSNMQRVTWLDLKKHTIYFWRCDHNLSKWSHLNLLELQI